MRESDEEHNLEPAQKIQSAEYSTKSFNLNRESANSARDSLQSGKKKDKKGCC